MAILYLDVDHLDLLKDWFKLRSRIIYFNQSGRRHSNITVVSYQFFIKMRAAFIASILARAMKEGESKEGSSHFDEKLSI